MTIQQAVKYDPTTDGMTDPAFVAAWVDAQIASGRTSAAVYAELDAMDV